LIERCWIRAVRSSRHTKTDTVTQTQIDRQRENEPASIARLLRAGAGACEQVGVVLRPASRVRGAARDAVVGGIRDVALRLLVLGGSGDPLANVLLRGTVGRDR